MKKLMTVLGAVSLLGVTGCQTTDWMQGNKETLGTASGAVIGGVLGSRVGGGSGQLWATGAGVLVGSLLGSGIGKSLDKADLVYANKANVKAHSAPIGQKVNWYNAQTGNSGTVTPTRDGRSVRGLYCREYEQSIRVAGQSETAVGVACQQADGRWVVQK